MQTVEMLVYIGVAIMIGTLTLGIITDWKFADMYDSFRKIMIRDDTSKYQRIGRDDAFIQIHTFFEECRRKVGNFSQGIYIEDPGTLTKEELFDQFKSVGWCSSIQSKEFDCGDKEDIEMNDLTLPRVVVMHCINNDFIKVE